VPRTAADLTAATAALIAAMASCDLTVEEAQAAAAVMMMMQFHRAALENLELETRIAALEAAKGSGT
jgi:hypothetical protein